jgi:hypothetical protein
MMRHCSRQLLILPLFLVLLNPRVVHAEPDDETPGAPALPARTSKYNQGNQLGRYRDQKHRIILFKLKHDEVPIYDGAGREIGRVKKPVMLNSGAAKDLSIDGKPKESFAWAWATGAGSGWIARSALVNPPKPDIDPTRNPKPAKDLETTLVINAAAGREKLKGLRHINSKGVIPPPGGCNGTDYAGRHPGDHDYVYLLFAVPNVIKGGMARDSLIDGSKFIPALDAKGNLITETMTMYEDTDMKKPKKVTFLYGREEKGTLYGWIARANVGDL